MEHQIDDVRSFERDRFTADFGAPERRRDQNGWSADGQADIGQYNVGLRIAGECQNIAFYQSARIGALIDRDRTRSAVVSRTKSYGMRAVDGCGARGELSRRMR